MKFQRTKTALRFIKSNRDDLYRRIMTLDIDYTQLRKILGLLENLKTSLQPLSNNLNSMDLAESIDNLYSQVEREFGKIDDMLSEAQKNWEAIENPVQDESEMLRNFGTNPPEEDFENQERFERADDYNVWEENQVAMDHEDY